MIGKALFAAAIAFAGPAQAELVRLDDAEIRAALTGNLVSYSPPDWFDAGAHEEFPASGEWRGIRYSFGPLDFSGKWTVRDDALCVSDIHGLWEKIGGPAELCRALWRDPQTRSLWMDHVSVGFDGLGGRPPRWGLQALKLKSLSDFGR